MTTEPEDSDEGWSLSSSLPITMSRATPPSSLPITMSRATPPSPSVSCVSSQSPVWRLSRILRNSFSKLRHRRSYLHTKSKSADILKNHDEDEETENVEEVSPYEQEMVLVSLRKGLPIIPFPMPNFEISNNNLEESRSIMRENSLDDMKFDVPSTGCPADRDHQSVTLTRVKLEKQENQVFNPILGLTAGEVNHRD